MARSRLTLDPLSAAKDLSGRTYIVTGANSGIGLETARQLVKQGGHVILACRRVEAGEAAAAEFVGLKGTSEVLRIDLGDLQTVRDFAAVFKAKHDRLDGLACNAGLLTMGSTPEYTVDGFERMIGVSYLGHFLLTELLLDLLKATPDARMAIVSSVVHAGSPKSRPDVHLDDLHFKTRTFNNLAAYAEAKVATVLYAKALARRLDGSGPAVFSVHPGWARSHFGAGGGLGVRIVMALMRPFLRLVSDSSEESAQTTLHCLISDDAPNHSGAYFSLHSALYRDKQCKAGGWPMETPNPNAKNMDTAQKLVELSYDLVGLQAPDKRS